MGLCPLTYSGWNDDRARVFRDAPPAERAEHQV